MPQLIPIGIDQALLQYLLPLLPYTLHPGWVPQLESIPAYSMVQVDEEQSYTLAGKATGYTKATYQFNVFSLTQADANSMQGALKDALNGYRGFLSGIRVWNCRMINSSNPVKENVDGSDEWIWSGVVEYLISYREFVPDFGIPVTPQTFNTPALDLGSMDMGPMA